MALADSGMEGSRDVNSPASTPARMRTESARIYARERRTMGAVFLASIFSHPDYDRRLRALTGILLWRVDRYGSPCLGSRARRMIIRITAGGDFHPAPKISMSRIAPQTPI